MDHTYTHRLIVQLTTINRTYSTATVQEGELTLGPLWKSVLFPTIQWWAAFPDANLQYQTGVLLSVINTMEADRKKKVIYHLKLEQSPQLISPEWIVSLPEVHWVFVPTSLLPPCIMIKHEKPLVAFAAPPMGTDSPGSTDVGPDPVTCFGQLNVGNVTLCQCWAKALRGIMCFYNQFCVSATTRRRACPGEPEIRHMEQTPYSPAAWSQMQLNPDQIKWILANS